MDSNKSVFLVVVSILEGRKFPKRPKHKLVVEARFDGELLLTDPVEHVESPDFTQELAWEVDRKSLQQHRLQRSTVKIICYAVDSVTTVKEQVGYIILDLRSAHVKQTSKWYSLLNTKYGRSKPELRAGLYLDEVRSSENGPAQQNKQSVSTSGNSTSALRPQLVESESLYQIGPPECTDIFYLSVTVSSASNLSQLIPSSVPLPALGYFFYYTLLGNDVTNEVFHDLFHPNFPVERSSVKIRSNVDILRQFFSSQPGLQIHLCCGDQSLGSCEVSLRNLLKSGSTEIFMRPISQDSKCQLVPPNVVRQKSMNSISDSVPTVSVTVALKKESNIVEKDDQADLKVQVNDSRAGFLTPPQKDVAPPERDLNISKTKTVAYKTADTNTEISHNSKEFTQNQSNMSNNCHNKLLEDKENSGFIKTSVKSAEKHTDPPSSNIWNRFTFSIDLRSIRDLTCTNTILVVLRYSYPFFGTTTPIVTHPATEISPKQEVLLPQSFCSFDFACTVHQLQETFTRVPLLVQMWMQSTVDGKDVLLATCQINLSQVLSSESTRILNNDKVGLRKVYSDKIQLQSTSEDGDVCGQLTYILSLEDWGPIDALQLNQIGSQFKDETVDQKTCRDSPPSKGPPKEGNSRESAEYQAALELEMWKEAQEQAFSAQLKQKEASHMKALADEWKLRDQEREIIVQKKIAEYSSLEQKLQVTITELDKREKTLVSKEQEVNRSRRDLHHEHELKLQEMREASRRLKEDCDHRVTMEKDKIANLEESLAKLKYALSESEKKYNQLENEFMSLKEQQKNSAEVRLQSELSLLTVEKGELERKLDAALKSKMHYKQQWGRGLKEISRMKQMEQDAAKAQLKKQQQELEQMKLRYLAIEERETIENERKTLEGIKEELNRLREREELKSKADSTSDSQIPKGDGDARIVNRNINEEKLAKLIEERDSLLRTGVYTSQDGIILKLDTQIREILASQT